MAAKGLVKKVNRIFDNLSRSWHLNPASVDAVQVIRDRMVRDLSSFRSEPTASQLAAYATSGGRVALGPMGCR